LSSVPSSENLSKFYDSLSAEQGHNLLVLAGITPSVSVMQAVSPTSEVKPPVVSHPVVTAPKPTMVAVMTKPSLSQVENALMKLTSTQKSQLPHTLDLSSSQISDLMALNSNHSVSNITKFYDSLSAEQGHNLLVLAGITPSVSVMHVISPTSEVKPQVMTKPSLSQVEDAIMKLTSVQKSQLPSNHSLDLSSSQIEYLAALRYNPSSSNINKFYNSLSAEQGHNLLLLAGITPSVSYPTSKVVSSITKLCKDFNLPCTSPEPFASLVDVLAASQYIEKAIHDSSVATTLVHLNKASQNLGYAQKYFETINNTTMANNIGNVINGLHTLINKVSAITPSKSSINKNLSKIQSFQLYAFQGVLGKLYIDLKKLNQ
jgi:hypothetical protein